MTDPNLEANRQLVESLDTLSEARRGELDVWLQLRLIERGDHAEPTERSRPWIDELKSRGHAIASERRRLLLWTKRGVAITPAGERTLAEKRAQLEELFGAVGGSVANGQAALRERGHDPRVFMLERMLLLHRRFDDQEAGFFSRCRGLSQRVQEFSSLDDGDDEDLLGLLLLG